MTFIFEIFSEVLLNARQSSDVLSNFDFEFELRRICCQKEFESLLRSELEGVSDSGVSKLESDLETPCFSLFCAYAKLRHQVKFEKALDASDPDISTNLASSKGDL